MTEELIEQSSSLKPHVKAKMNEILAVLKNNDFDTLDAFIESIARVKLGNRIIIRNRDGND